MLRIIPLFCALLFCADLAAKTVAGIDLSTLERPAGLQLDYQTGLQEQAAKRNVRKALDLIKVGQQEVETEDYFSKFADKTIDKSDVRASGAKKIREGEELLERAAESLLEIYADAQERADNMAEAGETGLLYEWTSMDDRKLKAKFVELAGDKLTVMNDTGTEFLIPLDKIIEEDRIVAKIMQSGIGYNDEGFLDAVASGSLGQVEDFFKSGFEPSGEIHGDAIGASIRDMNMSMLDFLIEQEFDINAFTQDGFTPLSLAVQEEQSLTVSKLLTLGGEALKSDTADPQFNPLEWAISKGDSSIINSLVLSRELELSDFMLSIVQFANQIPFSPVDIETVKELKAIEDGKSISNEELQAFKLSLFGLEPTITDLEKILVDKKLRPLATWYYAYDFYQHTIDQNQEYIDSLVGIWEERDRDGDSSASYSLALAYVNGWWNLSDTDRAIRLLEDAAEKRHTKSMILLGDLTLEGVVLERDTYKAYNYFRSAAELNDLLGMVRLGECYEKGYHVEESARKAFTWYERATEGGSTEGMAQLGRCYLNGTGVMQNSKLALEWYGKAAEANNLSAMRFLGEALISGNGMRSNAKQGVEWLKRAAEFGDREAYLQLGFAHMDGSVREDLRAAAEYFTQAAERGSEEGMYQIANCLKDGVGVRKDQQKAYEWYTLAAERDHLEALNQLAVCYSSGTGVDRNPKKAFELFSKASSQGHMQARANLAVCYAKGLGVAVDPDKAARLQIEVANSNDSEAKEVLKLLAEPTDD